MTTENTSAAKLEPAVSAAPAPGSAPVGLAEWSTSFPYPRLRKLAPIVSWVLSAFLMAQIFFMMLMFAEYNDAGYQFNSLQHFTESHISEFESRSVYSAVSVIIICSCTMVVCILMLAVFKKRRIEKQLEIYIDPSLLSPLDDQLALDRSFTRLQSFPFGFLFERFSMPLKRRTEAEWRQRAAAYSILIWARWLTPVMIFLGFTAFNNSFVFYLTFFGGNFVPVMMAVAVAVVVFLNANRKVRSYIKLLKVQKETLSGPWSLGIGKHGRPPTTHRSRPARANHTA